MSNSTKKRLRILSLGALMTFSAFQTEAQLTQVNSSGLANIGRGAAGVADFDNDGYLDLLLVGQTGTYLTVTGSINIYKGNGDGTFTDKTATWFPAEGFTAVGGAIVGVADYDNDGYVDFCYAGRTANENTISLIKNNLKSSSPFTDVTSTALPSPVGVHTGSIEWGDVNSDGFLDLFVQGRTFANLKYPSSKERASTSQLFLNNKAGAFIAGNITNMNVCYGQAKLIDIDNDGDLDIYYSGGGAICGFQKNDGSGNFLIDNVATSYKVHGIPLTLGADITIGDFNNDGKLDILQSVLNNNTSCSAGFYLYKNNNTSSTWADYTTISAINNVTYGLTGQAWTNTGNVACADYDNDGDLDYSIQGYNGTALTSDVYLNSGSGTSFTAAASSISGLHYGSMTWADFNNDGKADLLTHGYFDGAASTPATIIYTNGSSVANSAPAAPVLSTISTTSSTATLSWTAPSDDHTQVASLTYNLYVIDENNNYIIAPQADISSGLRRITGSGKYTTNSITLKALKIGTYRWSVQSIDAAYKGGTWATEGSFTISEETTLPTTQASMTTTPGISSTPHAITLNWTNGSGYKTIIFAKAGNNASELATPAANMAYTANLSFASGSQIESTGWYCVYNDAVTPASEGNATINALTPNTSYQFMVISYNGSSDNSTINYLTTAGTNNPAIVSTIDYSAPTTPIVSSVSVMNNTSGTSASVSITLNSFTDYNTVLFVKQASSDEVLTPQSNTTYTSNLQFSSGSQVLDASNIETGWFCVNKLTDVYKGSGAFYTLAEFTNLEPEKTYLVKACTYNGTEGYEKYSTTVGTLFTTPKSTATSIDTNSDIDVIVYPIPVRNEKLNVKVSNYENAQYVVFSLNGTTCIQGKLDGETTSIDLNTLTTGSYLIKIITSTGVSTQKFTKEL